MIKKTFLLLITIFFFAISTQARTTDFTNYCPAVPNQSFKISNVTGMNWLTEKIAEGIIRRELKKETKGKFKVDIKSTGAFDLMKGKFSSLTMKGTNLNIEGAHISEFYSNTLCEYNSVKTGKDDIKFRENMVLNYEIKIDNNALSQTIKDIGYVDILKRTGIPVNQVITQIRDNRIYYIFEIPTFVTKPIRLTISSGLTIKNGRLKLTGFQSSNNNYLNISKLINLLENTNPILFTSDIMNNKISRVYLDSAKIIKDTIVIKGLVLIPKNIEG